MNIVKIFYLLILLIYTLVVDVFLHLWHKIIGYKLLPGN
jgi:hypothetical protein